MASVPVWSSNSYTKYKTEKKISTQVAWNKNQEAKLFVVKVTRSD